MEYREIQRHLQVLRYADDVQNTEQSVRALLDFAICMLEDKEKAALDRMDRE